MADRCSDYDRAETEILVFMKGGVGGYDGNPLNYSGRYQGAIKRISVFFHTS